MIVCSEQMKLENLDTRIWRVQAVHIHTYTIFYVEDSIRYLSQETIVGTTLTYMYIRTVSKDCSLIVTPVMAEYA